MPVTVDTVEHVDGAVAELHVQADGTVTAEIRIPGGQS